MSGRISGRIVNNGLILHLDAGNTNSYISGNTTWNDLSNNRAILITNSGGTSFNTSNVGSVIFNSTNAFFNSNLILQPPNNLTISCWFKATDAPTPNDTFGGCLIIHTPQAVIGYTIGYSWLDQKISFGTQLNDFVISSIGSVLHNTIYNVTCVQSSTEQIIYLNGEFLTSRSYSTPNSYPSSGDRFLRVGNWDGFGGKRNFTGNIYQILMYDRALSANEAKQNYLALKGRFNF